MTQYSEAKTSLGLKLLTAGTAACIADLVTFPLDTLKVRLQVQGEKACTYPKDSHIVSPKKGMVSMFKTIVKTEGARSLYGGLSAGLQRQMCFASIRIGFYEPVRNFYTKFIYGDEDPGLNISLKILSGITTGTLCVIAAQPTDVVKVRYQAFVRGTGDAASDPNYGTSASLPSAPKINTHTFMFGAFRYSSTFQAYKQIAREDGMKGLWQGTLSNMVRNSVINCAEVVVYDTAKEQLILNDIMTDNIMCHFTSACIAGFVATMVASPIDVVKTRYMNAQVGIYSGALDCTLKMLQQEGPLALYKGCIPSFVRITSWNIVMWITFEQLKNLLYAKIDRKITP